MSVRDHRRGQWLRVNRDSASRLSVGDSVHSFHFAGPAALHVRQKRKPRLSILTGQIK